MANKKKKTHVVVLQGGLSSEREVSLMSGAAVIPALESRGYKVTPVDMDRNLAATLAKLKPDVVFNALHGTYGEDGCVQGLLEVMGIPYTHSDVFASAVAMDKAMTNRIVTAEGVLCPPSQVMPRGELLERMPNIARPYVVKPVSEGSSVGVQIIDETTEEFDTETLGDSKIFMVERYIPGRELSVAVTDDGPLGVIELKPKQGFYDYANKYTDNKTEHIMPADIDEETYQLAMDTAYKVHQLLGCKSLSRSDFRYDDQGDGKLYFLEINTHPGLTALSLVPEIAAYGGMSFEDLMEYLVETAK